MYLKWKFLQNFTEKIKHKITKVWNQLMSTIQGRQIKQAHLQILRLQFLILTPHFMKYSIYKFHNRNSTFFRLQHQLTDMRQYLIYINTWKKHTKAYTSFNKHNSSENYFMLIFSTLLLTNFHIKNKPQPQ